MNTQVIFKIDKTLKDRAMKKAQGDGVPFASVLKLATKAYVEGQLDIGIISQPEFNPKVRKELSEAVADSKKRKGLSPSFKSSKEMMAYIKKS